MPDEERENKEGFDALIRDLEDNLFGSETGEEAAGEAPVKETRRRMAFPMLVDEKTAKDILKDFMKEKNQRKYDIMGVEIIFKPYWFFTYTAELILRDASRNITDSEEIGSRVSVDAVDGSVVEYLQDLLEHEPIELVDLVDELAQVGEAKVIEPKITEAQLENFSKQKIAGVLRADKSEVSVAGFELVWAPVYKFWLTIGKKTHSVQIDGCGGYPVDYDDVPTKPTNWVERIRDDLEALKDPKKWGKYISERRKSHKGEKGLSNTALELIFGLCGLLLFFYGLSQRDNLLMLFGFVVVFAVFWHMNAKRKTPLVPLPPPPYMAGGKP